MTSKTSSTRASESGGPGYAILHDGGAPDTSGETELVSIRATPLFKEDFNAFHHPIDENKDFINAMPPEMLDRILLYCVLDHEPELALKTEQNGKTRKQASHVLLSLAAMSTTFRDCVESFCLRQLRNNRHVTHFKTTRLNKLVRRSTRLAGMPRPDNRVYRTEYLWFLHNCCVKCNKLNSHTAVMLNKVVCCKQCETGLGKTICLTEALRNYELRDYMLVPTRTPGPRAKHTNLPLIPYGTKKSGTALGIGNCISYHFYLKDVKRIANLVHKDLAAHLQKKRHARIARKREKVLPNMVEMKLRELRDAYRESYKWRNLDYFGKRIEHYESIDLEAEDAGDAVSDIDGEDYWGGDHELVCIELDCRRCRDDKVDWAKYGMEHRYDVF
ncbi:hypothetical protein LTR17_023307 [Elasticomyces elasticus]|nr:hypothetical protein LTR17_023307 [Elasticomyces elasticus]